MILSRHVKNINKCQVWLDCCSCYQKVVTQKVKYSSLNCCGNQQYKYSVRYRIVPCVLSNIKYRCLFNFREGASEKSHAVNKGNKICRQRVLRTVTNWCQESIHSAERTLMFATALVKPYFHTRLSGVWHSDHLLNRRKYVVWSWQTIYHYPDPRGKWNPPLLLHRPTPSSLYLVLITPMWPAWDD